MDLKSSERDTNDQEASKQNTNQKTNTSIKEIDEQELADISAPCGSTAVGIPLNKPASDKVAHSGGHPGIGHSSGNSGTSHPGSISSGHPGGHPSGHSGGHPHAQRGGHPGSIPGGARSMGFRPGAGPASLAYEARTGIKAPRIIAWEITRSCNLSCAHCRAASEFGHYPGELTLDEIKKVIDNITSITNPILILTGGEPLLRPDIWEIADYAHEKGAMPTIGTNATLITDDIAAQMAKHRIARTSVSLDFPNAKEHDDFRGEQGCFDDSVRGIKLMQKHGVGVQVNMTVTALNHTRIREMHEMCLDLGVDAFHVFLLVPTGRGEDLRDVELSPEQYETALTLAYDLQQESPLHIKPTDAPQYYRIVHQKAQALGSTVSAQQYGLDAITRGCLGGITFCFISHVGDVQPCGYFDMQLGNVKEQDYSEIWTNSPVFKDLRDYSLLKGKCGACEYNSVCGGCRARALANTGDYMEEEPYCAYVPQKWAVK